MQVASIGTTKNQLSHLMKRVKRGETILITDRNQPVAQLGPVRSSHETVAKLVAEGSLLPRAGRPLDVEAFLKRPRAKLSARKSLSAAVLEEREEGR